MKPKSHKIFKEGIAEEIGVHESVVDELVSFYFGKVRNALSSLEDQRVFVEGLGTFAIRKTRVEKAIAKNKSYLGNLEKHTYNGYDKTVATKEKIEVLEKVLEKINASIQERKDFKLKRDEFNRENFKE
jgi:nucleoid DNA-binding protein